MHKHEHVCYCDVFLLQTQVSTRASACLYDSLRLVRLTLERFRCSPGQLHHRQDNRNHLRPSWLEYRTLTSCQFDPPTDPVGWFLQNTKIHMGAEDIKPAKVYQQAFITLNCKPSSPSPHPPNSPTHYFGGSE